MMRNEMSVTGARFALQDIAERAGHTLILSGELDISAAGVLEGAVVELCLVGTASIRLDLSRLTFLDSTGLRAIVGASERCSAARVELEIARGPDHIHSLFALTGLLDRLPFAAGGDADYRPEADAILPKIFAADGERVEQS